MFTVSILYPKTDGATFDHDYYRDQHMPFVAGLLGEVLTSWTAEQCIDGPYEAIGRLVLTDVAAFGATMHSHSEELAADFAKYTTIAPQIAVAHVTGSSGVTPAVEGG